MQSTPSYDTCIYAIQKYQCKENSWVRPAKRNFICMYVPYITSPSWIVQHIKCKFLSEHPQLELKGRKFSFMRSCLVQMFLDASNLSQFLKLQRLDDELFPWTSYTSLSSSLKLPGHTRLKSPVLRLRHLGDFLGSSCWWMAPLQPIGARRRTMPRRLPYPPGARCDGGPGHHGRWKILTPPKKPNIGEHHPIPNHTLCFLCKNKQK